MSAVIVILLVLYIILYKLNLRYRRSDDGTFASRIRWEYWRSFRIAESVCLSGILLSFWVKIQSFQWSKIVALIGAIYLTFWVVVLIIRCICIALDLGFSGISRRLSIQKEKISDWINACRSETADIIISTTLHTVRIAAFFGTLLWMLFSLF